MAAQLSEKIEDSHITKERLTAIFKVNGIKKRKQIKIEHINNISLKKDQYIEDILVDECKVMKDVYSEVYQCNITDLFLMTSKKLPVFYTSVMYERPFKKVLLFRIYLFFTIESDIKDIDQLLSKQITGKFSFELLINNQKKEIDGDIGIFPGEKKMKKKILNFTKTNEMKELIKTLMEEVNDKLREQYKDEIVSYKMPTNIISLKDYELSESSE
jgi:hypothetical protein